MTQTAIEIIRDAAKNADSHLLDQPVYLDTEIGLYRFADTSTNKKVYVNVPTDKIVALGRSDFWQKGDTWRSITYRIHGKDWPHDVFNYFESPLEEQSFPAPASLYELRLLNVGGLCECGNGNHRLVAGRTWLTAKYGDKAQFKSAKISSYSIHPELLKVLTAAESCNAGIRTTTLDSYRRESLSVEGKPIKLLLATTNNPDQILAWTGYEVIPIKYKRTCLQWIRRQGPFDLYPWRTTPYPIIKGLLDDSWLQSQLPNAKKWSR